MIMMAICTKTSRTKSYAWTTCFAILVCTSGNLTLAQPNDFKVEDIASKFEDWKDNVLGQTYIQDVLDNAAITSRKILDSGAIGDQIVSEMSMKLSTRFTNKINAVISLRDALTIAYSDKARVASSRECCKLDVSSWEYDLQFGQQVDRTGTCVRIAEDVQRDAYTNPINDEITAVFKKNSQNIEDLKWQYFGSEEGIMFNYPAYKASSCDDYDPRFRPWYVEAATPVHKDIVVVIDNSGSMRGSAMDIARAAAVTVLETLNPNDRVNVVRFSSDASTPPGSATKSYCYANELAYALPDNIEYLTSFVNSIQADGSTNYVAALNVAFDLFIEGKTLSGKRKKVILFLTDGEPTVGGGASAILAKIAEKNGLLNNSVTIMTYGLYSSSQGLGENGAAVQLLQDMAKQTKTNSSIGEFTAGIYTAVESLDNLRYQLGSYYGFFSDSATYNNPVVTVPFIDAFGLGVILSMCLPVHYPASVLKGVTCVDITIADILGDIQFFPGEYSYAFLIDGTGRTLIHPLLPSPLNKDIIFLNIAELERAVEAEEVIAGMKRRESGSKIFVTTIVIERGNVTKEGVISQRMRASYFWKPVDNTEFSVCLVFTENDNEISISENDNVDNFLSHRFDLLMPNNACNAGSKIASTEMSSVKFTGEAYSDFTFYANQKMDSNDRQGLENYLKDNANSGWTRFKNGVKEMTVLTEEMDILWKRKHFPFVMARYIGTFNGVFRTFPGMSLPYSFDHMQRPWYDEAKSNKGLLVATIPYEDAFTGHTILSFVHTLQGPSTNGDVMAVVAMDTSVAYIHYILEELVPSCQNSAYNCFLVDRSGFLVYHSDFFRTDYRKSNAHITELEPYISNYLINSVNGYQPLKKNYCMNFGKKIFHYTWTLSLDKGPLNKWNEHRFVLEEVRGTNLFFGMKENNGQQSTCECASGSSNHYISECKTSVLNACECPCYVEAEYDYCDNEFPSSENQPICTGDKPPTDSTSLIADEDQLAAELPKCYEVNCGSAEYGEEKLCATVAASCVWCGHYCADKCVDEDSANAIVGGVMGGLAFLITIAVICLCCKKDKKPTSPARQTPAAAYTTTTTTTTTTPTSPPVPGQNGAPNGGATGSAAAAAAASSSTAEPSAPPAEGPTPPPPTMVKSGAPNAYPPSQTSMPPAPPPYSIYAVESPESPPPPYAALTPSTSAAVYHDGKEEPKRSMTPMD